MFGLCGLSLLFSRFLVHTMNVMIERTSLSIKIYVYVHLETFSPIDLLPKRIGEFSNTKLRCIKHVHDKIGNSDADLIDEQNQIVNIWS